MPIIKNTGRRRRTKTASGNRVKAYGRDKNRNRQGRQPSIAKEKKPEKLSKKEISDKFWSDHWKKYQKTEVGPGFGYTDSNVNNEINTNLVSENKNGKASSLSRFYEEGSSHNKDYNDFGEIINEDYVNSFMLNKNFNNKFSNKEGFVVYDKNKNIDMGTYSEYREEGFDGEEGSVDNSSTFLSYNARQKEIDFWNEAREFSSEARDKSTRKSFKKYFGKGKAAQKKEDQYFLASQKKKFSTGSLGLGGIKAKTLYLGEENAQPFLDKVKGIKTDAQNIDSRFKLSSEKFNNITGGKKSKLKFG